MEEKKCWREIYSNNDNETHTHTNACEERNEGNETVFFCVCVKKTE